MGGTLEVGQKLYCRNVLFSLNPGLHTSKALSIAYMVCVCVLDSAHLFFWGHATCISTCVRKCKGFACSCIRIQGCLACLPMHAYSMFGEIFPFMFCSYHFSMKASIQVCMCLCIHVSGICNDTKTCSCTVAIACLGMVNQCYMVSIWHSMEIVD